MKSEKFLILGALIAGSAFLCEHLILENGQAISLIAGLCLIVAAINLHDGETNAIEGATHFVLFATFIMLAVMGA